MIIPLFVKNNISLTVNVKYEQCCLNFNNLFNNLKRYARTSILPSSSVHVVNGKIKMKLHKTKKDKDLFYYLNAKGNKRSCHRYRYYDALGKRKKKSEQGFQSEKEAYKALLEVKGKGEALGLKWNDVDFKGKTVTVNRTRDKKGVRTPKTQNSYRTIRMDDSLIHQLKLYRTWCKQTMLSFGKHFSEDNFIFILYQSETPMGENTLKYCFDRIINKTGLKTTTTHGLRHTHATILLSQNQHVTVIAERLGNTPQMIWDTYGHNYKALEEESVNAFSEALNS